MLFIPGEDAVPKKVPKTIENQRVPDETMVHDDEEVLAMPSYMN